MVKTFILNIFLVLANSLDAITRWKV